MEKGIYQFNDYYMWHENEHPRHTTDFSSLKVWHEPKQFWDGISIEILLGANLKSSQNPKYANLKMVNFSLYQS